MAVGFLGSLGCVGIAIFLGPGLLFGIALVADSQRTIYERARSPDGWHDARVQFDDAGAISTFSRVVFVKHSWNLSDTPLLSCRAFWGDGQAQVQLHWVNNSTLLIQHHFAPQNVEAVASHCGSVKIITKAVQPFEEYGNA